MGKGAGGLEGSRFGMSCTRRVVEAEGRVRPGGNGICIQLAGGAGGVQVLLWCGSAGSAGLLGSGGLRAYLAKV